MVSEVLIDVTRATRCSEMRCTPGNGIWLVTLDVLGSLAWGEVPDLYCGRGPFHGYGTSVIGVESRTVGPWSS